MLLDAATGAVGMGNERGLGGAVVKVVHEKLLIGTGPEAVK